MSGEISFRHDQMHIDDQGYLSEQAYILNAFSNFITLVFPMNRFHKTLLDVSESHHLLINQYFALSLDQFNDKMAKLYLISLNEIF